MPQTHGFAKPLLALSAPLPGAGTGTPREALNLVPELGYRAVQLDATASGLRPRELDRSARRDLSSLFHRLGLHFAGLDLWIPAAHYCDPARADRALSSAVQAIELAADLASLSGPGPGDCDAGRVVCVTLPDGLTPDAMQHLSKAAASHGVVLADHAWPSRYATGEGSFGQGVDPAALLALGHDPVTAVATMKSTPKAARASDMGPVGRVVIGTRDGRLDLNAYSAALVSRGFRGAVVVDTRGLSDPADAARRALVAWSLPE